jgi:site-specific DNA recombinase
MWMGGNVPLGYDVRDRKLVINEAEAVTVRLIFRRYAERRLSQGGAQWPAL